VAASTGSSAATASARPASSAGARPISSTLDPERRAALLEAKLAALARTAGVDVEGAARGSFPGGATLQHGDAGWYLSDGEPHRAVGRALAWATQKGVGDLTIVVSEEGGGVAARRAAHFDHSVTVLELRGTNLVPADPSPAKAPPEPPEAALDLAPVIAAAGADVVVEHGVVTGEVLGLEIARVVVDDAGARIEVGVGRHDREAFAVVHGDVPTAEALASVISTVRTHRRATGPDHPLKRLAPERWLRDVVVAEPERVGAAHLDRVDGPAARPSVKEPWPAVAAGRDQQRQAIVVVTSVGIDLELVPFAADARAGIDPKARLVLVVPARDAHPVTTALAAALREPAEVVTVDDDWRIG
jgi:hypothetical protein